TGRGLSAVELPRDAGAGQRKAERHFGSGLRRYWAGADLRVGRGARLRVGSRADDGALYRAAVGGLSAAAECRGLAEPAVQQRPDEGHLQQGQRELPAGGAADGKRVFREPAH
nr:hypothetical protein [Tanacetum cinerariifolium]